MMRYFLRVYDRNLIHCIRYNMNRWLFWIIVCVCAWYILYYYRYPKEVTILQTTLPNFKFQLLLEKQPIVLQDRVTDLKELQSMWFPYMSTMQIWATTHEWYKNKHKYFVLQPQSDVLLYLYPRGKSLINGVPDSTQTLIEIKLQAYQVIILPYKYYYHFEENDIVIHTIAVNDFLTYILP
jgi:hypothetical protein